jgi:hypothetical protein
MDTVKVRKIRIDLQDPIRLGENDGANIDATDSGA